MKRITFAAIFMAMLTCAHAQTPTPVVDRVIDTHIIPRFVALSENSQALAGVALQDCNPTSQSLRMAYGAAFDAWISASHLRFGPTEIADRAFALAFWPDSRGATPRALNDLITSKDPIVSSVAGYQDVSIAARGFYALEFLLYDDAILEAAHDGYYCSLIQTISADIALTAESIRRDWQSGFAVQMASPSSSGNYRSNTEAVQELLKALSTGLQFTSETRLGRPLGTFERPRANRAEARRSERSALHVALSLTAMRDLAGYLADGDFELAETLNVSFDRALSQLNKLDDPVFASVSQPQTRFKVEVLQQAIENIRTIVREQLGPKLGVAAGFNSLDGD